MRAGAFFAPTDPHAYISGAVGSRFGVRRVTFPFHSPEFPTGAVFEGFTKCVVRADGGQEWRLIMSALRSELPQGDIHFGAFGLGDSPPPRVYLEAPHMQEVPQMQEAARPAGTPAIEDGANAAPRIQHEFRDGEATMAGAVASSLMAQCLVLEPQQVAPLYHLKMEGSSYSWTLLSAHCLRPAPGSSGGDSGEGSGEGSGRSRGRSSGEGRGSSSGEGSGSSGAFPAENFAVHVNPPSDNFLLSSSAFVDVLAANARHHHALGFNATIQYLRSHQYSMLSTDSPAFQALLAQGLLKVVVFDIVPEVHNFFCHRAIGGTGGAEAKRRHPSLAELRRPAATFQQEGWSPLGQQYYAIGNTFGYDVTGAGLPAGTKRARILLAGCGDWRNLLATVAAASGGGGGGSSSGDSGSSGGSGSQDGGGRGNAVQLEVVLNDGNLSMLARNAVLLHMAAELHAPPEALLAAWADHALAEPHAALLCASCAALAEDAWPAWLSASGGLDAAGADGDAAASAAEQAVRGACGAWASCSLPLERVLHARLGDDMQRTHAIDLSLRALGGADERRHRREVEHYIETGSLAGLAGSDGVTLAAPSAAAVRGGSGARAAGRTGGSSRGSAAAGAAAAAPLLQLNPTFLLAPELQHTVYFSTSIFRALQLAPLGGAAPTAAQRLLATAAPQFASVAQALRSGTQQVTLVPGDILAVATAAPRFVGGGGGGGAAHAAAAAAGGALFDFIDTSNVSDYTSVPALLQACAPLLSPVPHARLRLESITAYGQLCVQQRRQAVPPLQFVEHCLLGINLPAYEQLLRLRCLGGGELQPPGGQRTVRLEWAPQGAAQQGQISSSGSSSGDSRSSSASAGSSGWLSPAALLLELKPAFHTFVSKYTLPPSAQEALSGGNSSGAGGAGSGRGHALALRLQSLRLQSYAAPLTLVHLLSLGAPSMAPEVIAALLRTAPAGGSAGLFKWELTMHAGIHAGTIKQLSRVTFTANAGYGLLPHQTHPLLLALSASPLPRPLPPQGAVKQLLASFVWDETASQASALLPSSLTQATPPWARYLTLCVVGDNGLEVVGESQALAELDCATAEPQPWRTGAFAAAPHAAPGGRSQQQQQRQQQQQPPAQEWEAGQLLDCSLIKQVGLPASASRHSWHAAVHLAPGGGEVVVDVLAPAAIHPAAHVEVALVAGPALSIKLSPLKKARGAQGAGEGMVEGQHEVQLSLGLPGALQTPTTKMSRQLGLLCARIAIM